MGRTTHKTISTFIQMLPRHLPLGFPEKSNFSRGVVVLFGRPLKRNSRVADIVCEPRQLSNTMKIIFSASGLVESIPDDIHATATDRLFVIEL